MYILWQVNLTQQEDTVVRSEMGYTKHVMLVPAISSEYSTMHYPKKIKDEKIMFS